MNHDYIIMQMLLLMRVHRDWAVITYIYIYIYVQILLILCFRASAEIHIVPELSP